VITDGALLEGHRRGGGGLIDRWLIVGAVKLWNVPQQRLQLFIAHLLVFVIRLSFACLLLSLVEPLRPLARSGSSPLRVALGQLLAHLLRSLDDTKIAKQRMEKSAHILVYTVQ
jgi:hypothetical protein